MELNCGNVSWDAIVFYDWSFLGFAGKWVKLSLLKQTRNVKSRLNPTPNGCQSDFERKCFRMTVVRSSSSKQQTKIDIWGKMNSV